MRRLTAREWAHVLGLSERQVYRKLSEACTSAGKRRAKRNGRNSVVYSEARIRVAFPGKLPRNFDPEGKLLELVDSMDSLGEQYGVVEKALIALAKEVRLLRKQVDEH